MPGVLSVYFRVGCYLRCHLHYHMLFTAAAVAIAAAEVLWCAKLSRFTSWAG